MAKLSILKGTTSRRLQIFIQDSTVTTGAGKTGLANNTAGLVAYYFRDGAGSATSISLVSATVGTWTSGGFKEIDSANMPGLYEFDPPDAALASGANSVVFILKGATAMAPCVLEVELTSYDPYDGVRMGMTALPNAVPGAAGGVFIAGTNAATSVTTALTANITGNLSGSVGSVTGAVGSVTGAVGSVTGAVGSVTGAVGSVTGNVGGNVVGTVASVVGNVSGNVTGSVGSVVGAVGSVTAGVTVTTNNDKTGYSLAAAAVQAIWDALTSALTTVGSIGKRLADNIDATISSRSSYAGGDTSGTTTLLSRLTSGRATNLDNLDAAVTTRLATAGYTAPDNTNIVATKAVTDKLDTALALNAGAYRYTAASLALAPTGGSAPTAAVVAAAVWDELIAGHLAPGSTGTSLNSAGAAGDPWSASIPGAYGVGTAGYIVGNQLCTLGKGAITYTYTVISSIDSTPIGDVNVWVTTDLAGNNVVASGYTNSFGVIVFMLDAGTYQFFRSKTGVQFSNPDQELVS